MTPKAYVRSVIGATLVLVIGAWVLAWWLEPVRGDLTRVGGFAERHFGPQRPQLEFRPPLSTYGDWNHPVDVLVIGDSFANSPARQWQNWLTVATGWSIHTLDKGRISIDSVLANPIFRVRPPRVVVFNVVERDLLYEHGREADCKPYLPQVHGAPLLRQPEREAPVEVSRSMAWKDVNLGFARTWIWKSLLRQMHLGTASALKVALRRDDLFSSATSSQMLVYRDDLLKRNWKASDLGRIRCGLERLATRFESNRHTRFVTALAPDKSSAYHAWLADTTALPKGILPELTQGLRVPDANLHARLVERIAAGVKDVYLPNDTHWGHAGHQIAAEGILELLIREKVAQ